AVAFSVTVAVTITGLRSAHGGLAFGGGWVTACREKDEGQRDGKVSSHRAVRRASRREILAHARVLRSDANHNAGAHCNGRRQSDSASLSASSSVLGLVGATEPTSAGPLAGTPAGVAAAFAGDSP